MGLISLARSKPRPQSPMIQGLIVIRKYYNNLSITLTDRVQTKAENISLSLVVGSLLFCYAIESRF